MMKKISISILLIICTLLLFIGCTNNNVDKNKKKAVIETSKNNSKEENTSKSEKSKLYELTFDAVWEMDNALNSDIKYISINTKNFKDFSSEDKKKLFDYIAEKYKVTVLDMNIDELKTEGYVKDLFFKEGIMFQIDNYNSYSSTSVLFEGMKWRSGNGAIGFSCEAVNKNNKWELKKCNMTWIS